MCTHVLPDWQERESADSPTLKTFHSMIVLRIYNEFTLYLSSWMLWWMSPTTIKFLSDTALREYMSVSMKATPRRSLLSLKCHMKICENSTSCTCMNICMYVHTHCGYLPFVPCRQEWVHPLLQELRQFLSARGHRDTAPTQTATHYFTHSHKDIGMLVMHLELILGEWLSWLRYDIQYIENNNLQSIHIHIAY